MSLNQSQYVLSESLQPHSICIGLINGVLIETALVVNVQTVLATASEEDFQTIDQDLLVNSSTCFDVTIFSDDLLENDEFFRISIESRDSQLITQLSEALINITDSNSKAWLVNEPLAKYVRVVAA